MYPIITSRDEESLLIVNKTLYYANSFNFIHHVFPNQNEAEFKEINKLAQKKIYLIFLIFVLKFTDIVK